MLTSIPYRPNFDAEALLDVAERDDRDRRERGDDHDRRRERHQPRHAGGRIELLLARQLHARPRAAAAGRRGRRGWGRSGSGSGPAACARAAGSSARRASTNAKITTDLMIQTPVVSTNCRVGEREHQAVTQFGSCAVRQISTRRGCSVGEQVRVVLRGALDQHQAVPRFDAARGSRTVAVDRVAVAAHLDLVARCAGRGARRRAGSAPAACRPRGSAARASAR